MIASPKGNGRLLSANQYSGTTAGTGSLKTQSAAYDVYGNITNLRMGDLMARNSSFIERAGQLAVDDLLTTHRAARPRERREALRWAEDAALHSARTSSDKRVAAIKLLLASYPDSDGFLRELLESPIRGLVAEAQFTLFCYLDDIESDNRWLPLAAEVVGLVEGFLLRADSEAGHAAWMAGDLLGDHWTLDSSLPALLRAAREARWRPGRLGALHGLSMASRRQLTPAQREQVTAILAAIAGKDRSEVVRSVAHGLISESLRQ